MRDLLATSCTTRCTTCCQQVANKLTTSSQQIIKHFSKSEVYLLQLVGATCWKLVNTHICRHYLWCLYNKLATSQMNFACKIHLTCWQLVVYTSKVMPTDVCQQVANKLLANLKAKSEVYLLVTCWQLVGNLLETCWQQVVQQVVQLVANKSGIVETRVRFVGGDGGDFPRHWFAASPALLSRIASLPGMFFIPCTALGDSSIPPTGIDRYKFIVSQKPNKKSK